MRPTACVNSCGAGITYVENPEYASTNSLYSLWLARALLSEGCVVLNSDVLFHPQLLTDLLTARHEAALLLAYRQPGDPPFGEEEMKVKVRGGRVMDMSKRMDPADADGENVGIARFGARVAPLLVSQMVELVAAGNRREWAPRAFAAFAARRAAPRRRHARVPVDGDRLSRGLRPRGSTEILPQIDASAGIDTVQAAGAAIARGDGETGKDVRTVLPASRTAVRAQPRPGLPVSESSTSGGAGLPAVRHRRAGRFRRHHG